MARITELVLARVLPRRRRRHQVAVIGWGYAACLAACLGLVALFTNYAPARALVETTAGTISHRVVDTLGFATHLTGVLVLSIAGGVDLMASTGSRFAPIGRAVQAVLTTPAFAAALITAFAACAALLWWLRPAPARRRRSGPTDIGILGFWGMA